MNGDRIGDERAWWGRWSFALGQTRHWRIGPLDLWIQFLGREWLVRRSRGDDPLDESLAVASDLAVDESRTLEVDRVVGEPSMSELSLSPRLADRAVVVRPRDAFHVLEGCTVSLFVSSPLWVAIEIGDVGGELLLEMPTFRPSDTWFGPSNLSGDAAYAVSTSCRVDLDGLPIRPHRAVSPLRIHNPGPGRLTFERLAVPVPNLSLYRGHDGRLWTEALAVRHRDEGGGLADIELRPGAPEEAGEAEKISAPREDATEGIFRVFDALF